MNGLLWNMMLALIWVAVTGKFTASNLLLGFALGLLVLFFTRRIAGGPHYVYKVGQVFGLVVFFIVELILANLRVAYDVLTPRHHMRPGVVAVPLDVSTDGQITLLTSLITLTPGTLCLDVSEDRRVLYIHAMYVDDVETFRQKIKDGFERRVLEIFS